MKSIAVITDSAFRVDNSSTVGATIKKNLLDVFSDKVTVTTYYFDSLSSGDLIREDLILVMAGNRAIRIKEFVLKSDNIIVAKRTFSRSCVAPLYKIPEGAEVLVVNDDIETVLESVSSLYHIGIKHVNLIPYVAGKDYHHIQYAISPSETHLIPDYIEKIYDLGNRVIDIPTMLQVINFLKINDRETQQKLYNYYQEIFSPNEGIVQNYNTLLTRTEELDQLLDLSHDGILLTDKKGKILIYNRNFKKIFDINENSKLEGHDLQEILVDLDIDRYYSQDSHDDLLYFKKKIINVEKKDVIHFNKEVRMYFSFQEVTHIKKLEQNLSRKLRHIGHVARYDFSDIVARTERMKDIVKKAKKIAKTDLTVLITGESGTGKEILAQAIHNASPRKNQPFIAINSAAIPESLLESELFGYVSGSFTGALKEGKTGLFEKAHNGTVFLDEIGDMPMYLQSKLLRVLQERQIAPIGSERIIDIDIRVIAATLKDPMEMIASGSFRKDLFYRLNVFPLELPPLRDRSGDIPVLLNQFTGDRYRFRGDCLNFLTEYSWPGNIRELKNVTQYIATFEENEQVDLNSLPHYLINRQKNRRGAEIEDREERDSMILREKSSPGQSLTSPINRDDYYKKREKRQLSDGKRKSIPSVKGIIRHLNWILNRI
jgi:transcriptional regulator with PAS, ATPase and Fis domain